MVKNVTRTPWGIHAINEAIHIFYFDHPKSTPIPIDDFVQVISDLEKNGASDGVTGDVIDSIVVYGEKYDPGAEVIEVKLILCRDNDKIKNERDALLYNHDILVLFDSIAPKYIKEIGGNK